MSSQGFSFPPPPPPPAVSQQPLSYPSAQYGNGQWQGRGGSGRGVGGGRGRGRGHVNAGRAAHYSSDANRPPYNPPNHNSSPASYGYPPHPMSVVASYMPGTPYPPHVQNNYQHPPNPPPYRPPQHFSQPAGSAPYQPIPGFNNASHTHPNPYSTQTTPSYPPVQPPQHASSPNTPVIMGSTHWSPDPPAYAGQLGHGHGRGGHRGSHHGNHGPKPRHHNKRDHASAFNKPQSTAPKVPAPPAVPSFGNPLPCKPPPAADVTRKPPIKKRKRKQNVLGLTPKTDEHESSEEEEDVDEESKATNPDAGPMQITYKGRTSTLQSSTDIAAWIAERKKKFPTQARIEEKKKATEEANAAREAARREKAQERAKELEKQTPAAFNAGRKLNDAQEDPALEEAKRAQRKADKIRRTLDREQKRFAKAEAEAEAARLKVEALQRQVLVDPMMASNTDTPEGQTSPSATTSREITVAADGMDAMDLESDGSGATDWTSTSGSDSESDSDSDDDSAPEAVSSRRVGPEKVAPPPREGKKQTCRHFARTGQCNRGEKCKFSHDTPKQGPKSKPIDKKGRKGLFQALVEQQKSEEDKRAMEMISWLGQHGFLEPTLTAPQPEA
ncbi:hypothetical protein N7454_005018 [Penicillium verhagenii]|nr:hypothetical protein N7454_005018 [Penicillium verhagenii]